MSLQELTQRYDLCVTGEGLSHLQSVNRQQLLKLIPHIQVFARVVPKQKVRGLGGFLAGSHRDHRIMDWVGLEGP